VSDPIYEAQAYEIAKMARSISALEDENAKLRASNEVIAEDHAALCEQNAKLRELVRDYERCTMHADCSRCEYDGKMSTHCPLSPCFPDADELRELGVDA